MNIFNFRDMSCMFEEGEQHDAHELFLTVISAFNSVCQKVKESIVMYKNDEEIDCNIEMNMEVEEPLIDAVCTPSKELKKSKNQVKRPQKSYYIRNKAEKISKDINNMDLGFEGMLCYVILCMECEKRVQRFEHFLNLEVSIPDYLVTEGTIIYIIFENNCFFF